MSYLSSQVVEPNDYLKPHINLWNGFPERYLVPAAYSKTHFLSLWPSALLVCSRMGTMYLVFHSDVRVPRVPSYCRIEACQASISCALNSTIMAHQGSMVNNIAIY